MHWILDGYNIILSDERLTKAAGNDLETARDELIREITFSSKFKGDNVSLVFDGKTGSPDLKINSRLRVIFSKSPESADDLIKDMIGNYRTRRSIIVVSNDRSIADYARECGARTMKSTDFLSLIRAKEEEKMEEKSFSEKPPQPSKPDLELLKLFREKT